MTRVGDDFAKQLAADVARERERVEQERVQEGQARGKRRAWQRVGIESPDPDRQASSWATETIARLSSRPRRRRWAELDEFDRDVDDLNRRHEEAVARLHEAEAAVERAPEDDARRVAGWLAGGEKGDRPAPSLYERQVDRDAARMLADGLAAEVQRALEKRASYVERNRAKMVADAKRDVDAVVARYRQTVETLAAVREELLEARSVELWALSFPEPVVQAGSPSAVALGLLRPVKETIGVTAQTQFAAVLDLLGRDASAIATLMTEQQAAAAGVEDPDAPLREALWDSDPKSQQWKREQMEKLRQMHRAGGDTDALKADAEAFRG